MKGVTVDDIMSWQPCDGYEREIISQLFKAVCGRRKYGKLADALKLDIPADDKLWLVLRPEFIPERQLHEIAIWCWEEIARPVWEKHCSEDKRPHGAVRVKRLWLDGKATDEELDAAWDAARDAAWAAAWDAAGAAARAAAWDAARAAAWEKILNYIMEVSNAK